MLVVVDLLHLLHHVVEEHCLPLLHLVRSGQQGVDESVGGPKRGQTQLRGVLLVALGHSLLDDDGVKLHVLLAPAALLGLHHAPLLVDHPVIGPHPPVGGGHTHQTQCCYHPHTGTKGYGVNGRTTFSSRYLKLVLIWLERTERVEKSQLK